MDTEIEFSNLDAEIKKIIYETGAFIRKEFKNFSFSNVQYKGENDLVSYVDVTAEQMLKKVCATLIPDAGFHNEEGGIIESNNAYTWIIDPLDGTTNFTHGIPYFSISLALMYKAKLKMGYVYGVIPDEMFSAIEGQGAFLNGDPIHISAHEKLKTSIVVTGFPCEHKVWMEAYLGILADFVDHSHGFRRFGSAALDLAYVASGRFDAFFEFGLNPWDIAAGALLVNEAGGFTSDFDGGKNYIFGKEILATNGRIHAEMLSLIKKRLKIEDPQI